MPTFDLLTLEQKLFKVFNRWLDNIMLLRKQTLNNP